MGKNISVTVGHKIFMGGHVVFCHGPIDSIDTIEWDARAGWRGLATGGTITVDAENLFGGSKEASTTPGFGGGDNSDADGVSGEIDILMGEPTQLQNSYLQSVLGELIPAFRGVVSFVLKQMYLGNSETLRPLAAWGTRIHVKDDGQPQWYDEKAAIASNDSASYISKDSLWRYKVFNQESVQAPSGVVDLPATAPLFSSAAPGTVDLDGFWYENIAPFGYDSASDPAYLANINTIIGPTGGVQIWAIKEIETHSSNLTITLVAENSAHLYIDGVYSFSANPANWQTGAEQAQTMTINVTQGLHEIAVLVMNEKPETSGPPHPLGDKMFFYATCKNFTQVDINPAHFLRECYTSTVWGLKLPEYKINDDSFTAAADKLFAEGMGISLLWDRQGPVSELIDEIKRHIDADIYEDSEGLITLKLIRDDYVYDDLDVYDESNIIRIERGASTPERELINTVTVVYWDATTGKDASVQIPHAALVQMQGRINPTTIRYDFFTNADIATKKGEYDLRVMTSSLITYKVVTNRASEEKTIGDRFILNRPDVNAHNMVVRIIDVDLGNGINNEIIFTVTQEVFSLPAIPVMATSPDAVWVDPVRPAAPAPARLLFEQPYYELVQYQGQTQVDALLAADDTLAMLGVAAIRPSGTSLDAQVIVDDGAGYHEASTLDYCPSALLATAMNYTTKNITFTDEIDIDLVSVGTHCQIDDELLVVEALDLVARTATLGRGVLDTVPAKEHLIGARIFFWDYYNASDSVAYSDGENVDVKILTNSSLGRLPASAAPVDTIEFSGRAARPYPPGKLRVNGVNYGTTIGASAGLSIEACHRDRILQTAGTLQDTTVGDIGPEPGTTYTLRIYSAINALLRTIAALASPSYSYTTSAEEADMGGIGGGLAIDQYWDKTVLLVNMNGTNGSPVFIDSSPNFAIPNGNVHVTTSQLLFGSPMATFDGTGDYLNLPYVSNYDLGSSNFTIEYWFKPVSISVGQIHFEWRDVLATKGINIYQSAANPNKLTASVGDSNTAAYEVNITGTTTLVVGTLYHARLVKNGTNWQLYLNGATQGSATSSVVPYLNSAAIFFGAARDASSGFNGQAADLRVTKVARNASGFTAPSTRLGKYERQANHSDFKALLTFEGANNATTITDQSDLALGVTLYGNAKITTSQHWAGSSCLELDGDPNSMAWIAYHSSQRGSGSNITIDCRIRTSNIARAGVIAANGLPSSSTRAGWLIGITSAGKLYATGYTNTGAVAFTIVAASAIAANTWYHVELVRNGTQWQLFQEGASLGTDTETAALGVSNSEVSIGRDQNTLITWLGQIDEFAIRASAVDTSPFTPPAASYYPIDTYWSSTVVLVPMSGANNSTQFENIAEIAKLATPAGNAQVSTAQSKFGGASGLFDGAGDYITFEDRSSFHLDGDFTIECWLYGNFTGGDYIPILSQNASLASNNNRSMFVYSASTDPLPNAWTFYDWTTGTNILVTATDTPPVNTWFHLALSKQGNNYKFFRDGTQVGTTQVSAAAVQNVAGSMYIGAARLAGVTKYFNGYIDDLRITKAVRYPGAFSVSTLELGKYVPALNSQLRFELESVRDGLVSYQKHNVTVVRA